MPHKIVLSSVSYIICCLSLLLTSVITSLCHPKPSLHPCSPYNYYFPSPPLSSTATTQPTHLCIVEHFTQLRPHACTGSVQCILQLHFPRDSSQILALLHYIAPLLPHSQALASPHPTYILINPFPLTLHPYHPPPSPPLTCVCSSTTSPLTFTLHHSPCCPGRRSLQGAC